MRYSNKLLGPTVASAITLIVITNWIRGAMRTSFRAIRVRLSRLNAYLAASLAGMQVIQLFTREDNLTTGPVPYGAPTHQQMLQMMTPKEFSAPVADFSALFRWLTDKTK